MVESIINLGIKGNDLVESQIKKIQSEKTKLEKKSTVSIGSTISNLPKPGQGKGYGVLAANKITDKPRDRKDETTSMQVDKIIANSISLKEGGKETESDKSDIGKKADSKQENKDSFLSQYGQQVKTGFANAKNQAANSVLSMSGTGMAQAGIGAVTALIPVVGTQIGQAINFAIDAMKAFKEKIKQQASIVADTQAKVNDITNSFRKDVKGKSFEDFIGFDVKDKSGKTVRKERSDISQSEQAAIITSISSSMGKISSDFAKSVSDLFVSNDGKTNYDIGQATELAKGNFGALGTDKGFFMQQISSGFQGLPPSMKQKLTSQMFGMISPEERDIQNDMGIRSVQTGFDEKMRDKAAIGLGRTSKEVQANIGNAVRIQDIEDKLDLALQGVIAKATDRIARIANSGNPVQEIKSQGSEIVAGAASAASAAITSMSKDVVKSMNETKENFKQNMAEIGNSIKGNLQSLNPFK